MRNFDFITQLAQVIPAFSQLHAYCDKAEIFQKDFPEESASNARKALEWLVRNHLSMANVTLEPKETLNDMLKHPEIDAFIDEDWEFEQDMRTVKKIGNYASHTGAQEVKKNDAFICLRALYYVACGFLFRWRAIKSFPAFDATLVPDHFAGLHVIDNTEPTVSPEVVESVPTDAIEIEIAVEETQIPFIDIGDEAYITYPYDEEEDGTSGKVSAISQIAENGYYTVRVTPDAAPAYIGMSVEVRIND